MAENYFSDNADLCFYFEEMIPFQEIFEQLTDAEKETLSVSNPKEYKKAWIEVLEAFGDICGNMIAPTARRVEQERLRLEQGEVHIPATLAKNIQILKEFGVPGFSISPKYGGMGAPFLFEVIGCEMLNRACPSTMLNCAWYGPIANLIAEYGNESLCQHYIPKLASGEYSGNMALTEADAGSDLAALRTYAVKKNDGTYQLFGEKRFISNGQGDISLVLAKTSKGQVGLGHLSLFLCPRKLEGQHNYTISKLEDKVALHGSATCQLHFDASKAWLIGEEDQGYRYMLLLMNNSRVGVGFQGIGLMEAAWNLAHIYAKERKTWGKPIAQHELVANKLVQMEVELKALRRLAYESAKNRTFLSLAQRKLEQGSEFLTTQELTEQKTKVDALQAKVRMLTPLLKYRVGEKSLELAKDAMQVLGGYGFSKEYDAQRFLRESLIYPLYEGTSQMQALMCVKDMIKLIVKKPGDFLEQYFSSSLKRYLGSALERKVWQMRYNLNHAVLLVLIKLVKDNLNISIFAGKKRDLIRMMKLLKAEFLQFKQLRSALLNAELLCELKCSSVMADLLYDDAKAYPDRQWLCKSFVDGAVLASDYKRQRVATEASEVHKRLNAFSEEAQHDLGQSNAVRASSHV